MYCWTGQICWRPSTCKTWSGPLVTTNEISEGCDCGMNRKKSQICACHTCTRYNSESHAAMQFCCYGAAQFVFSLQVCGRGGICCQHVLGLARLCSCSHMWAFQCTPLLSLCTSSIRLLLQHGQRREVGTTAWQAPIEDGRRTEAYKQPSRPSDQLNPQAETTAAFPRVTTLSRLHT